MEDCATWTISWSFCLLHGNADSADELRRGSNARSTIVLRHADLPLSRFERAKDLLGAEGKNDQSEMACSDLTTVEAKQFSRSEPGFGLSSLSEAGSRSSREASISALVP